MKIKKQNVPQFSLSIHHCKSLLHNKIKTQIHSIVLVYSLFIDRQDSRCLYDKEQCLFYTGHWLAGRVGGGLKSYCCKGDGHKNLNSWHDVAILISHLVIVSYSLRSISPSSVKDRPTKTTDCVCRLKSPLWRKQHNCQSKAPIYKYIFYTSQYLYIAYMRESIWTRESGKCLW